MSVPETDAGVLTGTGGLTGQILIKLGELSTQLAVMNGKLEALPDHEERIRTLERIDTGAINDNKAALERLAGRVGMLERFRATVIGALIVVQVIVSVAEFFILHLVK